MTNGPLFERRGAGDAQETELTASLGNGNIQWIEHLPKGWRGLFTSLLQDLEKIDPAAEVVQAKQKFGELRVYLKTGSPEAYTLIDAATRVSRTTCEKCCAAAELRNLRGYYRTLCDAHADGEGPTEGDPIWASFRVSGGKISPRKR